VEYALFALPIVEGKSAAARAFLQVAESISAKTKGRYLFQLEK
jgi:hypothetical protein